MLTEQKGVIDDAKRKALSAAATVTGSVTVTATADGGRQTATAEGGRQTADGERRTETAAVAVAVSANHRRLCLDVLI